MVARSIRLKRRELRSYVRSPVVVFVCREIEHVQQTTTLVSSI